jgi:GAF domain-containing protein
MPMRATTVRFSDSLWTLIEREASRDGVSAAQYVRDATILRTAYTMGQRGDPNFEQAFALASGPAKPEPESHGGEERRRALLDAAAAVEDRDRLEALHATGLLDTDLSPSFDRLARLAANVLHAPVALVSLVDADREYFKSCLGLPEPWASRRQAPLSHSFCQHAVLHDNPAIRDMGIVAYAGIPLIDARGHALGTLCVIDSQPRHWTSDQVQLLGDIAASVVTEITLAQEVGSAA